ncbi:hypothetical protein SeMB42_g04885 [Synchytrium endobioticum]|uniref:UBZ4-type domain-containing protein n=1 Tax=Synchytrium endobioticum TaxID=286115 RepID=A0A507CV80_9FUNG|nr:hypothetical protein SeMB42_g04885 [Synchytrium endobioticum]
MSSKRPRDQDDGQSRPAPSTRSTASTSNPNETHVDMVKCPICRVFVASNNINSHLDQEHFGDDGTPTILATSNEPVQTPGTTTIADCGIRLLQVRDAEAWTNRACPGIRDILSMNGRLRKMLQVNFMVEIDWLMKVVPQESKHIPIYIVHGMRRSDVDTSRYPNAKAHAAYVPDAYGTHHTKMMILQFDDDTLRIVISSANLIEQDWKNKCQAAWISPPLKRKPASFSESQFEKDLVAYMKFETYRGLLDEWATLLSEYDCSPCRVVIVASVPGRHQKQDLHKWGLTRMAQVLQNVRCEGQGTLIAQYSSMGSLGKSDEWLAKVFFKAFAQSSARKDGILSNNTLGEMPDLKMVYPTIHEVVDSLEGISAGGSLRLSEKNWSAQERYLRPLLHKWVSHTQGRDGAMPHIKTYTRLNALGTVAWLFVTSHNVSKAAWGDLQKNKSQLYMRSYELGVLCYPDLFTDHEGVKASMVNVSPRNIPNEIGLFPTAPFSLDNALSNNNQIQSHSISVPIRLPYDVPLTRYAKHDVAWHIPDC